MTPVLSAEEGAQLLDGTGNSRLAALSTITPLLARPQSVAGMVKLLGGLQYAERVNGLKLLNSVTPIALGAGDVASLLEGTANEYASGLQVIASRSHVTSIEMDALLRGLPKPSQDRLRALFPPVAN